MPRDKGLEAMLDDALAGEPSVSAKAMFGGWAWMLHGNLLCAARVGSMLFRLGRENEVWALQQPGVVRMTFPGGRQMPGWVRAHTEAYGDPALFEGLVTKSLVFVRTLPPK